MIYFRKYVLLKEVEREEEKTKEDFEMKILLRKSAPMDIINIRPQTFVVR
jgi:hypothetical protein